MPSQGRRPFRAETERDRDSKRDRVLHGQCGTLYRKDAKRCRSCVLTGCFPWHNMKKSFPPVLKVITIPFRNAESRPRLSIQADGQPRVAMGRDSVQPGKQQGAHRTQISVSRPRDGKFIAS